MARITLRLLLVLLVLSAPLAGCHFVGPKAVRSGRRDYNMAVQQTNNEQLLLNLVRLRYRDTPYFLQVASISTSFELVTDVSGSAVFPKASPDTLGFGAGVEFTEKPTITYTPLHGDKFVKQVKQESEDVTARAEKILGALSAS